MSTYGGSTVYSSYTLANSVSSNTTFNNKVSNLVEQQFPQHFREDGPNLVAFIKGYYEYLEQANNSLEVSKNLLTYQDVDTTYEKYLEFIQREIMPNIPRDILADKKHLAKHIRDLYRTKGTEQSYRLLFRLLYNEEIDFYFPGDDMLRVSDGRWNQDRVIRVSTPRIGLADSLVGELIFGQTSGAQAQVTKYDSRLEAGVVVDQLYLTDIQGTFQDDELIRNIANTVNATIFNDAGPIQSISLVKKGAKHSINDRVSFTSTTGTGANGTITGINDESAVRYNIVFGGEGYNTNATVTVSGGSGSDANFRVASIKDTEILNISTTTIEAVKNHTINPTLQGGNTYASVTAIPANTVAMGANLASSNSQSLIVQAGNYVNTVVGTIESLEILDFGSGYSTLPSVTVTQNNVVVGDFLASNTFGGAFKGNNAIIVANNEPGAIETVRVDNFGDSYLGTTDVDINNLQRSGTQKATGTPSVSGVITFPGGYTDTKGFLSGSSKLQDNYYYQEYSYEIRSSQFVGKYRDLVKKLVHPSGTQLFGRLNLFANLDASFISMRSDATDSVQIEQVVEFDIPTIVTDTLDQYLLEEGALEIEPVQIDIELDANQADLEVVSHMNLFKQGTGNIFISNNVTIATFATSTINTFASLQIGEIATTRLVIGNNTVFTSEVPTTNTGILIVDSYQNISAIQLFFTNTTVSDTVLSLKLPFGDSSNTIANATFFYTSNNNA